MKAKILPIIFLLFMFPLLSGFALYHRYGPFTGKVIDVETKVPIEGAAVLAVYYTVFSGPGGQNDNYTNAQEVLTDENGEFNIHPLNDFTFRPFQHHASYVSFTIFKPGYGVFGGSGSFPGVLVDGERPRNSYLDGNKNSLIEVPKLRSRQERLKNLRRVYVSDDISKRKKKLIMKLKNSERKNLEL